MADKVFADYVAETINGIGDKMADGIGDAVLDNVLEDKSKLIMTAGSAVATGIVGSMVGKNLGTGGQILTTVGFAGVGAFAANAFGDEIMDAFTSGKEAISNAISGKTTTLATAEADAADDEMSL